MRKLKPVEMYFADKTNTEVFNRSSLRKSTIYLSQHSIDSKANKRYSELYFLLSEFTDNIFVKYEYNTKALTILDCIESKIKECEEFANNNPKDKRINKKLYDLSIEDLYKIPIEEVVIEWFEGRLANDININDAIFRVYIINQIQNRGD